MTRETIRALKWQHQYVAIFKCHRRETESGEQYVAEPLQVADGGEIESDTNLSRVVGTLQRDLVNKRLYRLANNPTSRILTFRSPAEGEQNQGQAHLDALLQARDKAEVRTRAEELARRYTEIKGRREGILLFLISRGASASQVAENCVFVFKCNFEAVSQITTEEMFRQVPDAIVEQTKKGALYPYFDAGRFDNTTVRVFDELGETQYWLEFLELGERITKAVSVPTAMLTKLPKDAMEKYPKLFEEPPAARPLAGVKRAILPGDRLPIPETQDLIRTVTTQAGERNITLRLDEVRITAPLGEYGRTWIVAEEKGQCYILVKGASLENRTQVPTPVDWAEWPSLRDAVTALKIPL
jgi:hypothetical protein